MTPISLFNPWVLLIIACDGGFTASDGRCEATMHTCQAVRGPPSLMRRLMAKQRSWPRR